jgi:hypothetical protein
MNHDYELAVFDRYPQLVYDMEELTVPVEYYAALWPTQYAEEEEIRRKAEEEDRLKAEAKARADAEKAAAAAQAAAAPTPAPAATATATQENGESAASSVTGSTVGAAPAADEAAAKRARLEELKRQAAEKARQRKESGE